MYRYTVCKYRYKRIYREYTGTNGGVRYGYMSLRYRYRRQRCDFGTGTGCGTGTVIYHMYRYTIYKYRYKRIYCEYTGTNTWY